jgi:protein-S-isoprenylcysteine O-methyltransferase Ste14
MTAENGKHTPTGRVPALNIERIYTTTVPADDLARALADHFRAQEFEAQVFRISGDRTAMQARKESLWRHLLGVAYALTVVFTPGEGQLSIGLGGHEWVDTAISGAIGLVAVQPVLLGTAYGIWQERQLDKQVWQVIDERTGAAAQAGA